MCGAQRGVSSTSMPVSGDACWLLDGARVCALASARPYTGLTGAHEAQMACREAMGLQAPPR